MADRFFQKTISFLFILLFFLTPLFFTPYNSELFEFNKIILVYGLTSLIVATWAGRIINQKRLSFKKSPLDLPLLIFLLSQIASSLFSIDPHTSFWGYYSRFNGGLASTFCYLLLYWAATNNLSRKDAVKIVKVSLASGLIVSTMGILEHFGHSLSCLLIEGNFDVSCWVQKVKERVFATLGQPNWLAAYLAILIPPAISLAIKAKTSTSRTYYLLLTTCYYLCLLFTGSRSGFLGLAVGLGAFWLIYLWQNRFRLKRAIKPLLIINLIFLILAVGFATPFPAINRFLHYRNWPFLPQESPPRSPPSLETAVGTVMEIGGSHSGEIRKIVWKGALDIFRHYPLFGSGVETFAQAYYRFRPLEHNLVSEWDFLYNKAHNEYLNYLSTTGAFGLGAHLLFLFVFALWGIKASLKSILKDETGGQSQPFLTLALLSGWLSILVSNFFGFSVVLVSLYCYLIPALAITLNRPEETAPAKKSFSLLSPVPFLIGFFLISKIVNLWQADYHYSLGQKLARRDLHLAAYQELTKAVQISPKEPVFVNELSAATAHLALIAHSQKQASTAAQLSQLAQEYSDQALGLSPQNLNFFKTRVRLFYTLASLNPTYLDQAIAALKKTMALAPTDPKLVYNLGLLYGQKQQVEEALSAIHQAVEMKPNYEEARNALAIFYEDLGEKEKALEQLRIIYAGKPFDESIKERIEKLESSKN